MNKRERKILLKIKRLVDEALGESLLEEAKNSMKKTDKIVNEAKELFGV